MHLDVEPVRYTTTTSTTTVAQKRHFKDEKKKLFLVDKLYEREWNGFQIEREGKTHITYIHTNTVNKGNDTGVIFTSERMKEKFRYFLYHNSTIVLLLLLFSFLFYHHFKNQAKKC